MSVLFGKKKQNDYYYEEYEDDAYYEEEDASSEKVMELTKQLAEEKEKYNLLQQEKENLELQYASIKALPKHYQQVEEEKETLKKDLRQAKEEERFIRDESLHLKEEKQQLDIELRQFKKELAYKQDEVDRLTSQVLNSSSFNKDDEEKLKMELAAVKEELRRASDKLVERRDFLRDQQITKEEIADVMLDAKAKARQILDEANYEGRRIVDDAKNEMNIVNKEAKVFYQRMLRTREDSEQLFDELLRKLATISQEE